MSETTCGHCGFQIHTTEPGIRHFGTYVAHSEERCRNLLSAKIDRLTAHIEELEKALKPLVEYAEQYRRSTLDIICSGPDGCVITRDDLRFARSTLEASDRNGGQK